MADTVLLKKIWTEFKIGVLVFTLIPLMHLSGATTTIGKSLAEVKTGDSFSITCTVSDLSGAVIFYQNSVEKGRCEASIIPGFPGVCVPGFSQDITTNISTYSVASANATGEDGTWSCKHSTETSDDLILIVYGFPANSIGNNQAYLPNNIVATTMDGTQLIVNISECVNPAPTINWTFYQDCEGISITPTIVITSTISNDPDIACSPPYSAYKSTIRNTDMTNAVIGDDHCYRVRSLVAYPGTSFMSVPVMFSANVTFTSVHTSTPTSITKPPPDNTCFLGIPDIEKIPCGIILAVIIIVIVTVAFVCFKLLRRNICNKQQSDKYKNHNTRNDGAAQAESTAKKTHENSAKRRDDNPSESKPNNEESKDSATDERVKQSRKSTDDMSQHEHLLNDDTNIGVKNGKKDEGTNRKDDNASIYTPKYRESQSSANSKRVNKSPESTSMDSLKQKESLANNAKNIGVKGDKNGLKSEDINVETNM